jgi:Bacterial PH domain
VTGPLEWSFNPWRDRPKAAIAAASFGLVGCFAVTSLGEAALLRLGLCLALLGSLAPLLSPAYVRVDEQGVALRGPFGVERRPWDSLRRAVEQPAGWFVSPYAAPSRLDRFRGLLLPFPNRPAEREPLRARLLEHLRDHGL